MPASRRARSSKVEHHAVHPPGFIVNHLRGLLLCFGCACRAIKQGLGETLDGGEGCFQFVADIGDKLSLRLLAGLHARIHLVECPRQFLDLVRAARRNGFCFRRRHSP